MDRGVNVVVDHPKWGKHTLRMVKEYDPKGMPEPFPSYVLYYPSGNYMGSLDEEGGGGLSHPNEDIKKFLKMYDIDLLDSMEQDYLALEDIIFKIIHAADPTFFTEEFRTHLNLK